MPITKILFNYSTPSIFESNWLTTWSPTPVSPPLEPLYLQIASISSNIITCKSESSPFSCNSFSAGSKSFLIFSSDSPTYFPNISGPLTTYGFWQFKASAIFLAIRVFPVPGGP
jgi:hypothetical protein